MDTSVFHEFSTKYGLDSEIVASFCEYVATHVDLPKEKWFKYNPPIEVKVVEPIKVEEKTITYNADPIVPTAYIEKPPFPVRIKDHAKASTVVCKCNAITPKFDCVKSFMDTDAFREFSTKYGLDSEIVASFCESFATHVDLPKEKWFKYHPPIKGDIKEPVLVKEETILYNVDSVVPSAYIEKPPFPSMIKLQL